MREGKKGNVEEFVPHRKLKWILPLYARLALNGDQLNALLKAGIMTVVLIPPLLLLYLCCPGDSYCRMAVLRGSFGFVWIAYYCQVGVVCRPVWPGVVYPLSVCLHPSR